MRLKIFVIVVLMLTGVLSGGTWMLLGSPQRASQPEVFSVRENTEGFDAARLLKEQNLIRNAEAFRWLFTLVTPNKIIVSGGYRLDRNMNAWQVMRAVTGKPQLVWVTVREGLRKEQIGELLVSALGWSVNAQEQWDTVYADTKPEYTEGVYFPDTYLLPLDETVQQIAQRFIDRFNEKFAPYFDKFQKKDIKWTTALKIASLIQREAAGPQDMPLIAGIIWNRLDRGMKLEIDATMQYTRGKHETGWWGSIDLAQKRSDSPYNTYIYKGLPPTPICNPGVAAIDAVLNPRETDCLYYLHSSDKQIHCATTYTEHKANIREYLD